MTFDRFLIINTATGETRESWPYRWQAVYFCSALNEHETANGRPAVYAVRERISPERP